MNENAAAGSEENSPPNLDHPIATRNVLYWVKRFLVCNPFYLASAALLLYGIARLAEAPDFPSETSQLFFNFGSLEVYEMLLIGTAIALARRAVWYDSTLLVCLESMFVLIPFILVSQAAFLGDEATWLICGLGALLAAGRFLSLRQFFPQLNLPNRLMEFGVVFLLVNIALPLLCKSRHQLNPGSVAQLSFIGWIWLMPALVAFGNLLPRPRHWGGTAPQRSWLPLAFVEIWALVSGYHLFRLGYVYDLTWGYGVMAPVLWVGAWTLFNRLTDFQSEPNRAWRHACLLLPCAATAVAAFHSDSGIFFVLSALNAAMFGFLAYRDRTNRLAFELALISIAAMLGGFPGTPGKVLLPQYGRKEFIEIAIGGYFVLRAILSRNPAAGVLGAIAVALGTHLFWGDIGKVEPLALQNGFLFALIHSLRWEDQGKSVYAVLRWFGALLWMLHSAVWVINAGLHESWPLMIYAAAVVAAYVVARWVSGAWGPLVLPISALIVLMMLPTRLLIEFLSEASIGILALLGSLLLFAIGTGLAWTKDKWIRHANSRAAP